MVGKSLCSRAWDWDAVDDSASEEGGQGQSRLTHPFLSYPCLSDVPQAWLASAFAHGHGIGTQLMTALLKKVDKARAVLLTHSSPTPAFRMYLKHGWQV